MSSLRSSAHSSTSTMAHAFSSIPSCAGISDMNHRLYLVTNENAHKEVLGTLGRAPQTGSLLIANSGMMPLNVFVVREQRELLSLLLIDCSTQVEHFWGRFAQLIQKVNCKFEAMRAIADLVIEERDRYYGDLDHYPGGTTGCAQANLLNFTRELELGVSWAATDSGFQKVKRLFTEKRFYFRLADWDDPNVIQSIVAGIALKRFRVDTIIQNNIYEYSQRKGGLFALERYRRGIGQLAGPKTWVVKTKARACACQELVQEAVLKGDLSLDLLFPSFKGCEGMQTRSAIFIASLSLSLVLVPLVKYYFSPIDPEKEYARAVIDRGMLALGLVGLALLSVRSTLRGRCV